MSKRFFCIATIDYKRATVFTRVFSVKVFL